MKLIQQLVLFLILSVFTAGTLLSADPEHFTFTSSTGNDMTIVIPLEINPSIGLDPLANLDEIGVFTPSGLCVGAGVWENVSLAITVWGDDTQTLAVDGAKAGEQIYFRVWDKSANIEYTSVSVSYAVGDGIFVIDGLHVAGSLVAAAKPGKPTFTNPTNNSSIVALNGNLTWNAAPGADSHRIQLSTQNNFATTIIDANGTFTSQAYSNLSHNTTYFARARGTNEEGDGDWETISFKTLLATPVLLTPANNTKGLTETNVNLTFSAVSGATMYMVELSKTPDFAIFNSQLVNTTNAVFNNLDVFSDYYWRVKAVDGANTSAFSAVNTFKTRVGTTTITNPVNNSVGVHQNGTFMWLAVNGATSYEVKFTKMPNTVVFTQNVAGTQLAYNNLENYTNYELRVTAQNADGSGAAVTSNFRSIIATPVLASPLDNSFNAGLSSSLMWNSVNAATAYDVRIATDPSFNNIVVQQNDINATIYNYVGLNNNQKYYWQVRAKNADGSGNFSSAFTFTTMLGIPVLTAPSNNAIQIPLNPVLQWNAVNGASMYHVQLSTNPSFTPPFIFENTAFAGTSVNVSGLSGKTNYYFRVKAKNTNNEGNFSAANMFTTTLDKVVLISPSNGAQGIIAANGTLVWQVQLGVTSYDLLVSTNSDLSNPVITVNQAGNSYMYSGLNNNTTYYWAVRANDINGNGPYSNTWTFGTQLTAPNLVSPANNAINVLLQGTASWTAIGGANSYQIQIANDPMFNNIVFDMSNINTTNVNYSGLSSNTTHYWRVRAYKGNGAGLWSNTFSFTTMLLAPPTLVYPPNNSIDLFTQVVLVWNPVVEASGYNIRIATDPNFINIVATGNNLQSTQFNVSNLFVDRDYYWQAQTIGGLGNSNWSTTFKFRTLGVPVINGIQTICENKNAVYSTTVSPLVDYHWSVTGGIIIGSSTGNNVTVKWGSAGQGVVYLTRTSAAWGNYTDDTMHVVEKTAVQQVDVTLGANTYFQDKACLNEWVSLYSTVNSNGLFNYAWKLNNSVVGTNADLMYHFTSAGTYIFTFEAMGVDCEAGSSQITIVVDGNCPVTIINEDDIFACKGDSPQLTTTVIGGSGQFNYAWTPSADLVNANVSSPIVISSNLSKTYKLTLTDVISGNVYYDLLDLVVRNSPSVSFSPASLVVNNSNPIDLTDPNVINVNINGGTAPFSYMWKDNNGNTIDPTNFVPNNGTNKLYLVVTDDNGCRSTEKRLLIIRVNNKLGAGDDITLGMNGSGFIYTYPNPVTDKLNIVTNFENNEQIRIKVLNLLGREVLSLNTDGIKESETFLSLDGLAAGAYTLIVETSSDIYVKTFIKQ